MRPRLIWMQALSRSPTWLPMPWMEASVMKFSTTCCSSSCSRFSSTCKVSLICFQIGRLLTYLEVPLAWQIIMKWARCSSRPRRISFKPWPIFKSSSQAARQILACKKGEARLKISVLWRNRLVWSSRRMPVLAASLASRARTGSSKWVLLSKWLSSR